MADIRGATRTTITGVGGKFPSRTPGDSVALSINTFILSKIRGAITGEELAPIVLEAIEPAYEQAVAEWPVMTGASRDSISKEVYEVGPNNARVALSAGGEQLINDPRNKSKKDYAPFIEFNGTPTTPPGTLTHAMIMNEDRAKEIIKAGIGRLIGGIIG